MNIAICLSCKQYDYCKHRKSLSASGQYATQCKEYRRVLPVLKEIFRKSVEERK